MLKNKSQRPVFIIDGSTFVSAGVLPYCEYNNTTYYLVQKRMDKPYLEDHGGKSDLNDQSIEDVALREMLEEFNMLAPVCKRPSKSPFTEELLKKQLPLCEQILAPASKYVLFFLKLDLMHDTKQYGTCEVDCNGKYTVKRIMKWVTKDELIRSKVHPRLHGLKKFLI